MARTATKRSAKRTTKRPQARRRTPAKRGGRRWSKRVTETSDALDLKGGVFTLRDPKKIAASLKRSAEHSKRRKTNPYRSALSMLTFYINRAGQGRTEAPVRQGLIARAVPAISAPQQGGRGWRTGNGGRA
jgi:hypothetical protein